jgi:NADPH:quinone reductase-like Zn-dependent oxidoreductase
MTAAVFSNTKSGKAVQLIEVEKPIPKDNEVLIQTRAASVNPLDWRQKSRRPGVDVAGEVVTCGRGVTQFKRGDAVFGVCKGAFAEYVCASETALVAKPDQLTFEQAACVPVAGLTALQGLQGKGKVQPGQKVLINGAAGGVGTFAVQIAKSLGAEVTGVCTTRNIEMVHSLGADIVIDYTQQDFTQTGRHYDLVLDNVGNRTFSALRRVMTPRGHCVLVGAPKSLPAALARMFKALVWPPFLPQKFTFFIAKVKQDDLAALCELMKTGRVTPVIDKCYRLSATSDAIAYVEQGHARAKVVVSFG